MVHHQGAEHRIEGPIGRGEPLDHPDLEVDGHATPRRSGAGTGDLLWAWVEAGDATLDATAALVAEHGLAAVTMSQIAREAGIGRATLYKYFPDVESILLAWHERQVAGHLARLVAIRDQVGDPSRRLEAVLESYALHHHGAGHHAGHRDADLHARHRHDTDVAAFLHRGEHMARAQQRLTDLIRDLLAEGAQSGAVREDVPPEELASYCLHALAAAGSLPSADAVRRLIMVTLAGLRPPP